jgi:hypothetical protein
MRRKLTTLRAKGGASENGCSRQLMDEAVYREFANFVATGSVYDTEYSGWSNASRPKDQAISLRASVVAADLFTVGGTLSGYDTGTGPLVLQINGGDDLTLTANGPFTFSDPLPNGSPYNVTVLTFPLGASLLSPISNNPGTVAGADVTDVGVVLTYPG